uniref:Uncharacterized protein n=1 Tax=Anguilla anguilla TaxID=7936 RepID=A0A0E9PQE6_ANGAN
MDDIVCFVCGEQGGPTDYLSNCNASENHCQVHIYVADVTCSCNANCGGSSLDRSI